jgi:hypothetical protein
MKTDALFTMLSFYSLVFLFVLFVVLLSLDTKRWHVLMTIFLGIVTAIIDTHSNEVSFSILLLLAFGFFLGFTHPSKPMRTALLLGAWVPCATVISTVVLHKPSLFWAEGIGSFVALVPSFLGAYLGVLVRKYSRGSALNELLPH